LLFLDPGSEIRDGKKSGSGIRDKHPGSATLLRSVQKSSPAGSFCMSLACFSAHLFCKKKLFAKIAPDGKK
jgi:hypothetical protein